MRPFTTTPIVPKSIAPESITHKHTTHKPIAPKSITPKFITPTTRSVIAIIPNSLTLFRVLASVLLIFMESMSIAFISIYLAIGFSDVLDGFLARKLHCTTKLGAMFDGFADALFILVCIFVFISYFELPAIVWIWCGCVAAIKIVALLMNYRGSGYFGFKSSVENKIAGVVLFLAPVCTFVVDTHLVIIIVGVVVTIAAIIDCIHGMIAFMR